MAALALLAAAAFAQAPTGPFKVLELEVIDPAAAPAGPRLDTDAEPRLDLTDRIELAEALARKNIVSAADPAKGRPRVRMADGHEVEVPLNLNVTLSTNRKTLLQYGDALLRMHPMRTDLFWIGRRGTITARVQNRFDGGALLDLSHDGFTAVAAPEYFAAREAANANRSAPPPMVDLYSPEGKRLWTKQLQKGTTIHHLLALPDGQGVAIAVAPADAPLERNQLRVLGKRPPLRDVTRGTTIDFGILQKMVLLGDGTAIFIQGSQAYGIVDLKAGQERWRHAGRIRMISPYGAVIGPEGKRLYVMTGERAATEATYRWTLSILDVVSGKPLGQIKLRGTYPGSAGPVFQTISDDRVTVRAGEKTLTVRIRPRG